MLVDKVQRESEFSFNDVLNIVKRYHSYKEKSNDKGKS